MKRTAPCNSIPNLCFSRNLKAIQKSGFLICLLIQGSKFSLLPELPLTMALPSTLGQIYERVHISGKNPGLSPLQAKLSMCPCCFMKRTVPCSSIPNLCFSRNLKQSRRVDSLSAFLFKEANFHCFLSYPLQWPSPALWARFMKGFTLVEKIPGRALYKQSCPCVLAAS